MSDPTATSQDHLSIRRVRAMPVVLPVTPPVETSAAVVRTAPVVLIEVETVHGEIGVAYIFCYTTRALRPLTNLVQSLGESIIGMPLAPRQITWRLRRELRLLGAEGLVGMALGGIDMALWDAAARIRGVSLAALLGGEPRALPAYCSLRSASPDAIAEEASNAVRRGFRAVKIRLGDPSEARDLAAVDAALSALQSSGPSSGSGHEPLEVQLMVDYNQALAALSISDAARRLARVVERADGRLGWIEEPMAANDDVGHAALGRRVNVPIQLGENWWGPEAAQAAITAGSAEIMMLDAMKIGGVTGWLQTAAVAEVNHRPVSSHLFPEISLQLLAVSSAAHWVEILDLLEPLRAAPFRIQDGYAYPTPAPGNGVTWDASLLASFVAP